jgi:hypothetical protein
MHPRTDDYSVFKKVLASRLKAVNDIVSGNSDTKILANMKHLYERLNQRDFSLRDLVDAIDNLESKLCQFLYFHHLSDDIKPFVINVRTESTILVLNRRGDCWMISTILNPKIHNLHDDDDTGLGFKVTIS